MNHTDSSAQAKYDPTQLVHDVYRLLLDQGLPVEREGNFDAAVVGAEQILQFLGLKPEVPSDLASYRKLDLDGQKAYNRRIHND